MKQLILMRHAKSDWSGGSTKDHDRPLNPRGRAAAERLGDWIRSHDLLPDQVLTSSALRTRETLMRLALPQDIPVHATRDLYLASADQIMDHLRKAQAQTVLILGHNPGIGNCAATLLATPVEHPKFRQYPSGATLVATFDIADWSDARWQNANARHFVVPREL